MEDLNQNDTFNFDLPKNQSSVIKVIGVGGGGSNAVNHMYKAGINGVDFAICNTDSQALENSPVPNKIQLGVNLTEGLGAGANPEVGQQAAEENLEEINALLHTNTKMVFITAGMGGGTGTGAAPVIAKAAKDCDILTVGIVTMPFKFEGNTRKAQAEKGIEELRASVDSLIVINNNKLREVYGNLGFKAGFAKADEVLAIAAKGIAEVITHHYTANIDLRDAKTVLANSGTAIMGSARASGENRAITAIEGALDSPLLNDNHIKGAKNVLLLIVSGQDEITMDEIGEVNDHIQKEAGGGANIIMGIGDDESLESEIAITIVATGFAADQQVQVIGREPQKVVHTLDDEQEVSTSLYTKPLQKDEDLDDDMIARELEKLNEPIEESTPQPDLFSENQPEEEALAQVEETPEPIKPEPEEEAPKTVYTLDTEEPEEEVTASAEEDKPEAETEETVAEIEVSNTEHKEEITAEHDEEVEMSFFISDENEDKEELKAEEPQQPDAKQEEQPKQEKKAEEPVVRHSLDDYLALEKSLNESKPTENKAPQKAREQKEEDEALQFEVKTKEVKKEEAETRETSAPRRNVAYEDLTIEQSLRLRQEERREQLKKFNHTFNMQSRTGVDKAEDIPAYKRQGLDLDASKPSSESNVSRFSIDESADGNDIKGNNSFLHDNVD